MLCPFCLHEKTEVYNSRSTSAGTQVWRRRRCLSCNATFTTQESFNPSDSWKVRGLKKTTRYSRPRLALSIIKACDHRPDIESTVWYLFEGIERQLLPLAASNNLIVSLNDITRITANVLKNFDATAYVKYMSYHQPTMDAGTLRKQLRNRA